MTIITINFLAFVYISLAYVIIFRKSQTDIEEIKERRKKDIASTLNSFTTYFASERSDSIYDNI